AREASRPCPRLHPQAQRCLGDHRRRDRRLVHRQWPRRVPSSSRRGGPDMNARIPVGMDNPHYAYSPIDRRPKLVWPDGRRIAFWVTLHLEYWELDPPDGTHRDPRFVGEYGTY